LRGKVSVDVRLALKVAAGRFGARLCGLSHTEGVVQELVWIGCAGVLSDEQQDAPVSGLEDGQEPPFPVETQPTDGRQPWAGQADSCGGASASSYVVDGDE
jgi:hypothetical protein